MKTTALFVDFDNVYSGLLRSSSVWAERFAREPARWIRWLTMEMQAIGSKDPLGFDPEIDTRRVLVRRCYLNPVHFNQYRRPFHEAGFEIVDCPPMTAAGKTSTDIHLVLDVLDALQDSTRFDEFMVFSADADFSPLLRRLRRHDRRTAIFAAGAMSASYKASADVVIDIDTFVQHGLGFGFDSPEDFNEDISNFDIQINKNIFLQRELEEYIFEIVQNDNLPVPFGLLASMLQERMPAVITGKWFGNLNLYNLLRNVKIHGLHIDFETQTVFDQRRRNGVQPPIRPQIVATQSEPITQIETLKIETTVELTSDQTAANYIHKIVTQSDTPVHLSEMGNVLKKKFPDLAASSWSGARTLNNYIERLAPHLGTLIKVHLTSGNTFVVMDPAKHERPKQAIVSDLTVSSMLRAAEMPQIHPRDLKLVLEQLWEHLGNENFQIEPISRLINAQLRSSGEIQAAKQATSIIQALIYGGLDPAVIVNNTEDMTTIAVAVILSAWSRETLMQVDNDARTHFLFWLANEEK